MEGGAAPKVSVINIVYSCTSLFLFCQSEGGGGFAEIRRKNREAVAKKDFPRVPKSSAATSSSTPVAVEKRSSAASVSYAGAPVKTNTTTTAQDLILRGAYINIKTKVLLCVLCSSV